MNLRRSQRIFVQIPALASLSSPHFDANPFLMGAAMCPIRRPNPCHGPWRIDGASAVVMGICRRFESNLALTIHPNMRFDDGHV